METLKEFQDNLLSEQAQTVKNDSIFDVKKANTFIDIAKKRPIPQMLFGELWYEREVCILFADTNVGKSILAVQIANSISKGISTCGLKLECPATPVLYFDFEMSDKQFEGRYSNEFENHYIFSDYFLRAEFDLEYIAKKSDQNIEDYLFAYLEKLIIKYQLKILIVDNITYLKDDNEKAKDAGPLMKILNNLSKQYGLSILVLAHTPKTDPYKPIIKNHLSGSKILMTLCDSSFTIGTSHQQVGLRYIKQIKQRFCEETYGADKVIVCQIEKPDNFLQFSFVEFDEERRQLKVSTAEEKDERTSNIIELHKKKISNTEIARQLNISEGTVRRILKITNL